MVSWLRLNENLENLRRHAAENGIEGAVGPEAARGAKATRAGGSRPAGAEGQPAEDGEGPGVEGEVGRAELKQPPAR